MKKGLKITLIVIGVLLCLVIVDTLQAKIFNNAPLLKIRENLDGGNTDYIDKGIFVNFYHCNNDEKNTTWKWTKYACPVSVKTLDLTCLKNELGGYITSEKVTLKEEKLENIIKYNEEDVEYSYVMKSKLGIYIIIKATDNPIKELDKYFAKEYKGYLTTTNNDYKIYVYNNENDFNLDDTIENCLVD